MSNVHTIMAAETLEALRGSIAKWEHIVDGTGLQLGPDNCPLCLRFNPMKNPSALSGCADCPVAQKTGRPVCEGTPYDDYSEAEESDDDDAEERMEFHAKAELDFLKSLLPTDALSDERQAV